MIIKHACYLAVMIWQCKYCSWFCWLTVKFSIFVQNNINLVENEGTGYFSLLPLPTLVFKEKLVSVQEVVRGQKLATLSGNGCSFCPSLPNFVLIYCQADLGQQIPAAQVYQHGESNSAHTVVLLLLDYVRHIKTKAICTSISGPLPWGCSQKASSYAP